MNSQKLNCYWTFFCVFFSGLANGEEIDIHFIVLSNRKDLSLEEVWDENTKEELPNEEAVIVFSF